MLGGCRFLPDKVRALAGSMEEGCGSGVEELGSSPAHANHDQVTSPF